MSCWVVESAALGASGYGFIDSVFVYRFLFWGPANRAEFEHLVKFIASIWHLFLVNIKRKTYTVFTKDEKTVN